MTGCTQERARDSQNVLLTAEVAYPAHDLDTESDCTTLASETLAQFC
jgi:hypothetical protein